MPAFRFCGSCGAELRRELSFGRERGVCPACGWIDFEHLKLGAAALVVRGNQILLAKRTNDPFAGMWNLPAGYVEADEPPDAAARREAHEELGIDAVTDGIFGVFYFDDDPRGNGVLIVYTCSARGEPSPSHETSDVGFFAADDLPSELAGAGHSAAILAWSQTSS